MYTGTITEDGSVEVAAKAGSQGRGNFTTVYVSGTFGAGTVQVAVTPDNVTWFDVTDGSLTAKGFVNVDVKTVGVRLTLSGATSPALAYSVI